MTAFIGRREFITLLGGAAAAWPLAARAQQPGERMRRVGVLVALPEDDANMKARVAALRQGLERRGWSDGRNIRIDYRHALAGNHVQALAKELVALQPRRTRRAYGNTCRRSTAGNPRNSDCICQYW